MRKFIALLVITITLGITQGANAGPHEDAVAAYNRDDYTTALSLWRPLANQGEARAQTGLGVMYQNGHGVPQDYKEAMRWYRLAAAQGNALAQYNLGSMYERGRAVPQEYVRAHMWFSFTADGKYHINRVAAKMTPAQIEQAQEMARKCKESNFKNCD